MLFNQLARRHIFILVALGVLVIVFVACFYGTSGGGDLTPPALHSKCHKSTVVDTSQSTLQLVHIIFRHGARTPVDTYPKDPYVSYDFHPNGWGHVTNKGKRELFSMGSWLNKRYAEFLQPFYSPERVHAQATASPRALMSLSTVLASLFPPKGTPMDWNPTYNWQPVPIFSEPLDQDGLLLVRTPCPRYFEARDEVLRLPAIRAELARHESLLRNLTELTGMPVESAEDVNSLYITLEAERDFGLALPSWTDDYFPEKMRFLAEQSYIYNAYTSEMQKIKGGPFLKKMLGEMQQKRAGQLLPRERKLFIYTGHDWSVGNILSALKVWQRQMPLFAIMTIFELHKHLETDQYYVEIFLRNDEDGCLRQLQVPGCTLKCPLDQLIALAADVLPNEPYDQRCTPKNSRYVEPPPRPVDLLAPPIH